MARGSSLAPRRRHRLPWLPGLQSSRSASSPRSVSREVWLARGRHPALSSTSPTLPGAALALLMTVASLHSGLWGSGHSLSHPCSQLTNPAWTIFETRSHFSRCYPAGHARIRPLFRNRASNPTANNEQNEPAPSQLTGGHPHTVSSRLLQPTEASASLRERQTCLFSGHCTAVTRDRPISPPLSFISELERPTSLAAAIKHTASLCGRADGAVALETHITKAYLLVPLVQKRSSPPCTAARSPG